MPAQRRQRAVWLLFRVVRKNVGKQNMCLREIPVPVTVPKNWSFVWIDYEFTKRVLTKFSKAIPPGDIYKGLSKGKWLMLLPHSSLVSGSGLSLHYCLCDSQFYMFFPCMYGFFLTFLKHASRSVGYFKIALMPLGVKECMQGALLWTGVFPN